MSFAKIGSNATAPPNSTANRSSVIADKEQRVRAHEPEPREHLAARVRLLDGGGTRTGMVRSITMKSAARPRQPQTPAVAPPVAAISIPPTAGPMIAAS